MILGTILSIFALWGLIDLYMMYRFVRKDEVDTTAGFLIWVMLKWSFASQTKLMAEKLPFISQDLTEMLGIRPDDGEIT